MSTTVSKISISGKAFVDENNNRFVVKGVALSTKGTSLGIDDILSDDYNSLMVNTILPKLQSLNVNCIRVYQVHPQNSHKKTMKDLENAGIYVMVGLANPTDSVKQMTGEYNYGTFKNAAALVDEFQAYNNTLCFSVGNEVEFPGQMASNIYDQDKSKSSADIVSETKALQLTVAQAMKSFARDIKAHIKANSYRAIPVGAAMQDGPQTSWNNTNKVPYQVGLIGTDIIAQYYAAGEASERMDYIGINSYAYKSNATGLNAYDRLGEECSALPVPAFLTETGAQATPRTWAIVPEMYTNSAVYKQLSGQVAFQMLEEGAGWGLYDVSGSGNSATLTATTDGGATALGAEFAKTEPSNAASSTPSGTTTAPTTFGSNPSVTVEWPSLLTPFTAPDISVIVENYADMEIQVTQRESVMGTVSSGSQNNPNSGTIKLFSNTAVTIQAHNGENWDEVCGVPAANVTDGITIKTNVAWGQPCNVTS